MRWLIFNWQTALQLAWAHLLLAFPAIILSVFIAIPLGRFAHRFPRIGKPILTAATLLYAIPALPLLVIVPGIFGTKLRSSATLVIALCIYGVALLVRTVTDAFNSVDRQTLNAAVAIGYSRRNLLWRVELPLALPVIISGIRVVAVSTISLVTIGSLVGIQSLGTLLTDGFQRGIAIEIATGICATIALALMLDALLIFVRYLVAPWTRTEKGARKKRRKDRKGNSQEKGRDGKRRGEQNRRGEHREYPRDNQENRPLSGNFERLDYRRDNSESEDSSEMSSSEKTMRSTPRTRLGKHRGKHVAERETPSHMPSTNQKTPVNQGDNSQTLENAGQTAAEEPATAPDVEEAKATRADGVKK